MNIIRSMTNLLILFALFGCIALPSTQSQNGTNVSHGCKTVTSSEPYSESVCQNVSTMEEICQTKELNYTLVKDTQTDFCLENNLCTYLYSNGTCAISLCSKGMSRCKANLTNLDTQKSGTWDVAANFTFDNAVFAQNPITKTILPKEQEIFDYSLFYDIGLGQEKPICLIYVKTPAKLQDCNYVTTIERQCANETKFKTIDTEVCD